MVAVVFLAPISHFGIVIGFEMIALGGAIIAAGKLLRCISCLISNKLGFVGVVVILISFLQKGKCNFVP